MENLQKCRINAMVANMDKSIAFYTETLELDLIQQYGNYYAEIQAPGLLIGLHPASEKTTIGTNLSIGFSVVNFDNTIEKLSAKGIEFKLEQEGYIRLAYFTDLDKNQLFLAENKN
mgnify:CR=1 FL=1